jgi:hypothetical protein
MAYSKYRAKPVVVDNIRFASQKEAKRYGELKLLQMAGNISDLKLQERFSIEINGVHICDYLADFCYTENGERITEDVKGVKTDVYRIKRLLMWAVLGVEIMEV